MAHTSFTHSCGHTGNTVRRNRKTADYLASRRATEPCWECQKAAEHAAAKQAAEAAGLPGLTGTPNQIPYGETLRARQLPLLKAAFDKLRARISTSGLLPAQMQEMSDALILVKNEAAGSTEAKFWIEGPSDWTRWACDQIVKRNLAPSTAAAHAAAEDGI